MGCWNGTCGLSNLPILHGDKCRLILLFQSGDDCSKGGGGFCYSMSLRGIYSFPICGQYNDYGGMEKIEKNWYVDFLLSQINKEIEDKQIRVKGNDRYPEIKSKSPFSCMEDFLTSVERGFVECLDIVSRKFVPMSFMFMREDIYKNTLGYFKKCIQDDTWMSTFMKRGMDKLNILPYMDRKDFRTGFAMGEIPVSFGCDYNVALFRNGLINYLLDHPLLFEHGAYMYEDYLRLMIFMEHTRKAFIEGCGAGSQGQDFQLYKKHFENCLKVIDDIEKRFDEE
jgi:hypothetical protein